MSELGDLHRYFEEHAEAAGEALMIGDVCVPEMGGPLYGQHRIAVTVAGSGDHKALVAYAARLAIKDFVSSQGFGVIAIQHLQNETASARQKFIDEMHDALDKMEAADLPHGGER